MEELERLEIKKTILKENRERIQKEYLNKTINCQAQMEEAEKTLNNYKQENCNSKTRNIYLYIKNEQCNINHINKIEIKKQRNKELENYIESLPEETKRIINEIIKLEMTYDVAKGSYCGNLENLLKGIENFNNLVQIEEEKIKNIQNKNQDIENIEFFKKAHLDCIDYYEAVLFDLKNEIRDLTERLERKRNVLSSGNIKVLNRFDESMKKYDTFGYDDPETEESIELREVRRANYNECLNALPMQTREYIMIRESLRDMLYIYGIRTIEAIKNHTYKEYQCDVKSVNLDDSLGMNEKSILKSNLKEQNRQKQKQITL